MTLRVFRAWKMKDPRTNKTVYIPLDKLETNHLTAICKRLIAKAQFQWAMYTFECLMAGESITDDWWDYRHALLEFLLDEARKRDIELELLEPTSQKSGQRRWLKALLRSLGAQEIELNLKGSRSEATMAS